MIAVYFSLIQEETSSDSVFKAVAAISEGCAVGLYRKHPIQWQESETQQNHHV